MASSVRTGHEPSQLSQLMTLACRGELAHPLTRSNQVFDGGLDAVFRR